MSKALTQTLPISEKSILNIGAAFFLICISVGALLGNYFVLAAPFVLAAAVWLIINWKSFYWVFVLSIPLSFEVQLGSFATTFPDEPIMWVFVPLVLLLLAYNYKSIPRWFLSNKITLIIFLQFVWLIVSVIYSQNHFLSVKYLLAKVWFNIAYIILPVLIIKDKRDINKLFLLFIVPTIMHAMVIFAWHATLNFDYWDSNTVVKPFYVNHVDHSTVLSMIFPVIWMVWQMCKGRKQDRWVLGLILVFLLPAIAVAGARAAILAVIFSFIIYFAIRKRLVNWIMPLFFLFIGSVIFWLSHNQTFVKLRPELKYTATQRSFEELITATFKGRDMSSMERFYRWIACVKMSTDRPLVGVGPNNFYDNYKAYTVPMFRTWVSRNPERSTTHNYFLFMLVEQGWPAMILYGILVVSVLAYAQKLYHKLRDPYYKNVVMACVMMFAAGFVNNFFSELLETHKIGFLFFLSITLLVIIDELDKRKSQLPSPNN
jgi:O-antigen ligase